MARLIGVILFVGVVLAVVGGWQATARENASLAQQVAVLKARVTVLDSNAVPTATALHGPKDSRMRWPDGTSPLAERAGHVYMICPSADVSKASETQPRLTEQQAFELGCTHMYDVPRATSAVGGLL